MDAIRNAFSGSSNDLEEQEQDSSFFGSARKSIFGGSSESQPRTLWDEIDSEFTLTFKQRLIGFVSTVILASIFSFLAILFLLDITTFAVFYTLSNILLLASTCFLIGPMRQLKNIFAPTRAVAALIYLVAMALTLYAAIGLESAILALFMILVQILALVWYTASYIPYARQCLTSCVQGLFDDWLRDTMAVALAHRKFIGLLFIKFVF